MSHDIAETSTHFANSEETDETLNQTESFFNRPPRILRLLPDEEVEIPAPPSRPSAGMPRQLVMILLPLFTAAFYIIVLVARAGSGGNIWFSLPIVGISIISASLGIYNYRQQKRMHEQAVRDYENAYNEALEHARHRLKYLEHEQQRLRAENDPDLPTVLHIARGDCDQEGNLQPQPRLWERRPGDSDFLAVRIGRGDLPTSVTIKPPRANEFQLSPELRNALKLASQFALVRNVPIAVSLYQRGSLGIAGPSGTTLALIRAMLWQITVHHAPREIRIAAFWESKANTSWEWLRWLPHTRSLDGDEDYRLLAQYDGSPEDMRQVLDSLTRELQQRAEQGHSAGARPHLVLVMSDYHKHGTNIEEFAQVLRSGKSLGFSALCLVDDMRQIPGECGGYIDLKTTPTLALTGTDGGYRQFTPDMAERKESRELAHYLAPIMQVDSDGRRELPRNVHLLPLLVTRDNKTIEDAKQFDPWLFWNDIPKDSWHPVPCGLCGVGEPLEVDLNESVHGVHGMIAGTTGSGKSEFLLTFLLALAIKHSPDRVNFMLIDFKGGATFTDLEQLPHTAGVVTDLEGYMAERALIAINSELDRRKQRFARAGVPNIRSYRNDRRQLESHPDYGPVPNLLIAIDEFDEMVRDYPEFVNELIRVAKQGRSLGVHLLFATQQPSAIKEGLTRNLTYWIALRVTATDDSKAMVKIPDAAYLTTDTPGRGFFRVNKQIVQFQSARVTIPYQPPIPGGHLGQVDVTGRRQIITAQDLGIEELRNHTLKQLASLSANLPGAATYLTESFLRQYKALQDKGRLPKSDHYHKNTDQIQHNIVEEFTRHLDQLQQSAQNDDGADSDTTEDLVKRLVKLLQGDQGHETEIALIAQTMIATRGICYAANQYPIWTEPLPDKLALISLLHKQPGGNHLWMQAPIGSLDFPATAEQKPLLLDLVGQHGNLLVLGSAGSGKTTLLRTLVLALAATHSPADLWIYTIDPGGNGFGFMLPVQKEQAVPGRRLPHLADTIAPHEKSKVERLLLELQGEIDQRRALLRDHGVDTLTQYRERWKNGKDSSLPSPPPAILIVIENAAEFGMVNPDAIETLKTLIRDARACEINFVVTAYGWKDINAIQSNFETRIALRLNDPNDSESVIGKPFAARIKPEQAGRAFLRTSERPVELQIALPILLPPQAAMAGNGNATNSNVVYSDLAYELERAMAEICTRYQHITTGCPQQLRALPTQIKLAELLVAPTSATTPAGIPIAVDNLSLQPLTLDLADATPHMLIAGGPRSGKTELLRTLLTGLACTHTPDEVQFILVDYRRRVLQRFEHLPHTRQFELEVPTPTPTSSTKEPRTIRIIKNETELKALVSDILVPEMRQRSETGDYTPRLVLAISNWDLFQGTEVTQLNALAQFAMQARDLGLHLIITGTEYANMTSSNLLKTARLERCAVYLGMPSESSMVAGNLNIKLQQRQIAHLEMPVGRGFFLRQGQLHLAQFALATPELLTTPLPQVC